MNLHDDLRVVPETGEIVWTSERTGYKHIELHDKSGRLVRVLTSGEWPVDAIVQLDVKRREVWFLAGAEDPLESQLYLVSLEGGSIRRKTGEAGVHKAVVSSDGETFVDTYSTRKHPPKTVLKSRDGKLLATIHDAAKDPRVDELSMPPPEPTEFKNRDGMTLFGLYYAPKNKPLGTKAPLVVLLYGGPHLQYVNNSWDMTADVRAHYLTEHGFACWKIDNRGSCGRGHVFEAPINRDMGSIEVQDQVDGVKFASASFPEIDPTRVGVTGGSYGGYMTLRTLLLAPETFHAGVSIAPVTDWDGYDTCYTERYMGTPKDNPEGYKRSSVLHCADKLKGKLLLIHGLLDENVHFRHSARLTNALVAAGKPFEFLPLPDSRHGSRKESDRKYIAERTLEFFTRALGPVATN